MKRQTCCSQRSHILTITKNPVTSSSSVAFSHLRLIQKSSILTLPIHFVALVGRLKRLMRKFNFASSFLPE